MAENFNFSEDTFLLKLNFFPWYDFEFNYSYTIVLIFFKLADSIKRS